MLKRRRSLNIPQPLLSADSSPRGLARGTVTGSDAVRPGRLRAGSWGVSSSRRLGTSRGNKLLVEETAQWLVF